MKWIAVCFALAGFAVSAHASAPGSALVQMSRSDYVQVAGLTQCPPPKVLQNGACVCPRGAKCESTNTCAPPMVPNPRTGACMCPAGTHAVPGGGCAR